MEKRQLTAATVPTVFGMDVKSSGVSICKMTSEMTRPVCAFTAAPHIVNVSHSVVSSLHRQRTTTKKVLERVLRDDVRPHLVVMGKLSWGLQDKDPTAPRRMGQWWDIAEALTDLKVPVAEIPLASAAVWALGSSPGMNAAGLAAIREDLVGKWEGLDEAITAAGSTFQPSAVLYAAFGAMTVGMSTPYAPTEDRVRRLSMRRAWKSSESKRASEWTQNMGAQFPAAVRPVPTTVSEWNSRAAKLGVAQPEPEFTTDTEVA